VTEKKTWGSTVMGWFVERDDKDSTLAEVEAEAAAEEAAPATPAPAAPPVQLAGDVPLPAAGAAIDFAGIYRAARIGEEEQGRVEKALALLKNLPAETPREVKRQIVEASLKAFGYPVEQIIQAGVAEINALQAYIEFSHRNTQRVVAETGARIEGLEKEIADLKSLIEQKAAAQQALAGQSNQQKLRVQEVLEFFGQETVERVLRESPKPGEPAQ